ncbi:MAG: hypothetical protein AB1411_02165 [Nitrospirota bacterium]
MLKTLTIEDCLSNRLDPRARRAKRLAGIVGENPSKYAKSPSIWNPVLEAMGLETYYSPFDVEAGQLVAFVEAARHEERLKGFSVTVPYKVAIIPLLDELDPKARAIGAVNVVTRTDEGKLIGANTDGSGAIASLTTPLPGSSAPFLADLTGKDVLLIGAGGAGKAVAWYLADAIGKGRLYLATRDRKSGSTLCEALSTVNPSTAWIEEMAIPAVAPTVQLIINATTKGQSGIRALPDGRVSCLEPYSALAPACPAPLPATLAADQARFYETWFRSSLADLTVNLDRSARLLVTIPQAVAFMDIIYSPLESAMLRQARLSGHRTLNGKGMNVCQAADALFHWVFRREFEEQGLDQPAVYRGIVERMGSVW